MKVLILTGSYGAGHTIASTTLSAYYLSKGHEVEVLDIASFLSHGFGNFTKQYYNHFCHEFPSAWKYTDKVLATKTVLNFMHAIPTPIFQERFDEYMSSYSPDIIIDVFPWWSIFLHQYYEKNKKKSLLGIMITDSITIHPFWYANIAKYTDVFFVIDDFSNVILRKLLKKIPVDVVTSFFPIEKHYFITKKKISNKNIVIVLSGLKYSFVKVFLEQMKDSDRAITIVKARNSGAFKKLQDLFLSQANYTFIDYLPIRDHLQDIDIIIGKPGGAIMSECIATDTVLLIPEYFPGQEEGNMQLIEKIRLGVYEPDPEKMSLLLKNTDWDTYIGSREYKKSDTLDIIYRRLIGSELIKNPK